MQTSRNLPIPLALPSALVTLVTLFLFFVADQTLDSLRTSIRMADIWMDADRAAVIQLDHCLDRGGADCDLVRERLKPPLAFVRATRERAKPHPDMRVIREAMEEMGLEHPSPFRFRLRWFERIIGLAGLDLDGDDRQATQTARAQGSNPPDIQRLLDLTGRARAIRAQAKPDPAAIAALRSEIAALGSRQEEIRRAFDVKAGAASLRLRRVLYLVVMSSVLAMFVIATWVSQRMLSAWQTRERALVERDRRLNRELERHVAELQAALADRNTLLREVRHRVKNNLAVVSALLSLEADRSEGSEARSVLAATATAFVPWR